MLTLISLSKGRRKRPVPEDWVTPDEVSAFEAETNNALPVPQATSLDVEDTTAAIGGLKGDSATYLIEADKLGQQIAVGAPVTATLYAASKVIYATSQGSLKVYQGDDQVVEVTEHAGAATALSTHPGGQILASAGSDKSLVLYDLASMKRISRTYADSRERSHRILTTFADIQSFDYVCFPPRWPPRRSGHRLREDQALHDQDAGAGRRVRHWRPGPGRSVFRERFLAGGHGQEPDHGDSL